MFLSQTDADAIDGHIARVEDRTGVQVVTAVVSKSDAYVELPWKAFALGASLAAFAVVLSEWIRPDWPGAHAALLHTVAILGAGAACALAAVFVPSFARLFLRPARRDLEVRHYAQSLFLRRELFKTRERNSVLILISRFERKVEILPDVGLHDRVSETEWQKIIVAMAPLLREARFVDALQAGLSALGDLLAGKGFRRRPGTTNELSDRPIEEDPAQ